MTWVRLSDSLSWSQGHSGKGYLLDDGTIKTWNVDPFQPLDQRSRWEGERESSPLALNFEIDPDGGVVTARPSPRVQAIIEADPRLYDAGQRPVFEDDFNLDHYDSTPKADKSPDYNFIMSGWDWARAPHRNRWTGKLCQCGWGTPTGMLRNSSWHFGGQQLNRILKAPDKAYRTPEGQAFLEHLRSLNERDEDQHDSLMPYLAQRFKKGDVRHVADGIGGHLQYLLEPEHTVSENKLVPAEDGGPGHHYEQVERTVPARWGNVTHRLPDWHQWYEARQHPTRRGVNVMDPTFTPLDMERASRAHQQALEEARKKERWLERYGYARPEHVFGPEAGKYKGWQVMPLDAEQAEGDSAALGHCIGKDDQPYKHNIDMGNIKAYSLRDREGYPHVSWHINPSGDDIGHMQGASGYPNEEYRHLISLFNKEHSLPDDESGREEELEPQYDREYRLPDPADVSDFISQYDDPYEWAHDDHEANIGEDTMIIPGDPRWNSIANDYLNHHNEDRARRLHSILDEDRYAHSEFLDALRAELDTSDSDHREAIRNWNQGGARVPEEKIEAASTPNEVDKYNEALAEGEEPEPSDWDMMARDYLAYPSHYAPEEYGGPSEYGTFHENIKQGPPYHYYPMADALRRNVNWQDADHTTALNHWNQAFPGELGIQQPPPPPRVPWVDPNQTQLFESSRSDTRATATGHTSTIYPKMLCPVCGGSGGKEPRNEYDSLDDLMAELSTPGTCKSCKGLGSIPVYPHGDVNPAERYDPSGWGAIGQEWTHEPRSVPYLNDPARLETPKYGAWHFADAGYNWDNETVRDMLNGSWEHEWQLLAEKLVDQGVSVDQFRDAILRKVVGPWNKQQLKETQEWNAIPLEERQRRKRQHDIDQFGEEAVNLFQPLWEGVEDIRTDRDPDEPRPEPPEVESADVIDPEKVDWYGIYHEIHDSLDEGAEYDRQQTEQKARAKELGIGWSRQGGDDVDKLRDAFYRYHGAVPEEEMENAHHSDPRHEHKIYVNMPFEQVQQIPNWHTEYADARNAVWKHRYKRAEDAARQQLAGPPRNLSPEKIEQMLAKGSEGGFLGGRDYIRPHFPGGRYDTDPNMDDPEERALIMSHPSVQKLQAEGYNKRLHELFGDVKHAVEYGQPHPYTGQMTEALQQRGYSPEEIQRLTAQKWQWDEIAQTRIPVNAEPPVAQWGPQAVDQPGDTYLPEGWGTTSATNWEGLGVMGPIRTDPAQTPRPPRSDTEAIYRAIGEAMERGDREEAQRLYAELPDWLNPMRQAGVDRALASEATPIEDCPRCDSGAMQRSVDGVYQCPTCGYHPGANEPVGSTDWGPHEEHLWFGPGFNQMPGTNVPMMRSPDGRHYRNERANEQKPMNRYNPNSPRIPGDLPRDMPIRQGTAVPDTHMLAPAVELKEWLADLGTQTPEAPSIHHDSEDDLIQAPPVSTADDLPYFPPANIPKEYKQSAIADPVATSYYHVSNPENRDSILTNGLRPSGRYGDQVWLWPDLKRAQMYGLGHKDVWEVDPTGLQATYGQGNWNALTVPGGVAPAQMRLYQEGQPRQNPMAEIWNRSASADATPDDLRCQQCGGPVQYHPRASWYEDPYYQCPTCPSGLTGSDAPGRMQHLGVPLSGIPEIDHNIYRGVQGTWRPAHDVQRDTRAADELLDMLEGRDQEHLGGMTLPQQQRHWEQLKQQFPHEPNMLWQNPEGWSVQEHNDPNAVQAVGEQMANCWQSCRNPQYMQWGLQAQSDSPENSTYRALHDPYGIPRVAFYWQPGNIELPMGHGTNDPKPEHVAQLMQWVNTLPYPVTADGKSLDQGWPDYSPATEGYERFKRRNRISAHRTADSPITQADATNDALGKSPALIPSRSGDPDYIEASICPNCQQLHRPDEPCPDSSVTQYKQQERQWYNRDPNAIHGAPDGLSDHPIDLAKTTATGV